MTRSLTPLLLLTCVVSVLCALGMPPLAAGKAQPAGSTASPTVSAPQPNVSGVVAAASSPRPPALPPGAPGAPVNAPRVRTRVQIVCFPRLLFVTAAMNQITAR